MVSIVIKNSHLIEKPCFHSFNLKSALLCNVRIFEIKEQWNTQKKSTNKKDYVHLTGNDDLESINDIKEN